MYGTGDKQFSKSIIGNTNFQVSKGIGYVSVDDWARIEPESGRLAKYN
jgi:hypothetical protein